MLSCEIRKILKNSGFSELFQMAASLSYLKSGAAIFRYSDLKLLLGVLTTMLGIRGNRGRNSAAGSRRSKTNSRWTNQSNDWLK